ncbi:E3 ubiquitin/ISG15 ligase TRIM25-like [Cyclopterus lumpus]|uniref:E3 ubiquitin/ISG15 ligase TRIM25-like n=1 Tax=Cyclopterus lumpus TaxID=8103 RepID=UPI001486A31C|nr:E3 ubiquitin/ISG15 ligase TRIM25-like [Cyclopterus lumpus]
MASAQASPCDTSLLEKHLLCSICMDLFENPVTTTCGHSFCKECLDKTFRCDLDGCPLCKEYLRKTPEVNIVLRNIVEETKEMKERKERKDDEYTGASGEVACDICTKRKLKAKKSCLVCLASYCSKHLENHSTKARLKGHKVVEPVENLDERACLKHGRPLELYSRRTETCICALCIREGQEEIVSIEDEWDKKKGKLENTKTDLHEKIQKRRTRMDETDTSLKSCEDQMDTEWRDIDNVFTAVADIVEEAQATALKPLKERREVVKEEANGIRKELEAEINSLEKTISELDNISLLEDHILFLKSYPSLTELDNLKNLGVARSDANRKGRLSLNPDNGYWVIVHYEEEEYAALTAPPVRLSLQNKPETVGVFVDFEKGLVSFYDMTAQSHIYSFAQEGSFGDDLLPYFSPHAKQNEKNADALIISGEKYCKEDMKSL